MFVPIFSIRNSILALRKEMQDLSLGEQRKGQITVPVAMWGMLNEE